MEVQPLQTSVINPVIPALKGVDSVRLALPPAPPPNVESALTEPSVADESEVVLELSESGVPGSASEASGPTPRRFAVDPETEQALFALRNSQWRGKQDRTESSPAGRSLQAEVVEGGNRAGETRLSPTLADAGLTSGSPIPGPLLPAYLDQSPYRGLFVDLVV